MRVLGYLYRTAHLGITYGGNGPPSTRLEAVRRSLRDGDLWQSKGRLPVELMSDANWEHKESSVSAYLAMLYGAVVDWMSKRQPSAALSSTEAETFAPCFTQ